MDRWVVEVWRLEQVRKLPKAPRIKQGRLRDLDGKLVGSERRSETLAEYLEKVQWTVKFAQLVPPVTELHSEALPIDTAPFRSAELRKVIKHLKDKRACGLDCIPAEFWKALLANDDATSHLLSLCNKCLCTGEIPQTWRTSSVVTIFKKGDTSQPSNYRPISLLAVGYKVLASLILQRLRTAGAEARLANSQFGFRPQRGTADALFVIRRIIDAAIDDQDASLYIVLLDWSKAFDRVKHDALLSALHRFGIRGAFHDLIAGIYQARTFSVFDAGVESSTHKQAAGIAQGCPLSPYLFVILMTIAMTDAKMWSHVVEQKPYIVSADLVYADDTMLLTSSPASAQALLNNVSAAGQQYGLELNLEKTVLLRVRGNADIFGSDGVALKAKSQAVYLGSLLTTSGEVAPELHRRIGEACACFQTLTAVWKHANLPKMKKYRIFKACIVSKLLYGLESLWLLKAHLQKLEAFGARCLRKIAGVPMAFISRVSNQTVLDMFGAEPLSTILKQRQLKLFWKIAQQPNESLTRKMTFEDSSNVPRDWKPKRRIGRPCQRWVQSDTEMAGI